MKSSTRREFLRTSAKTAGLGLLAMLAPRCTNYLPIDSPGYLTMPNINRQVRDNSLNAWAEFYTSIKPSPESRVCKIAPQEKEYVKKYLGLSQKQRIKSLDRPELKEFNFLDKKEPGIPEAVFLYYFERYNQR